MAISTRIAGYMERSSWIRKMFETGAQLKAQFGADKVYDFSLGNPNVEPPQEFVEALARLTADPEPGMHAYMPNAGYPWVREKIAAHVREHLGGGVQADNVLMTVGAGGAMNTILKTLLNAGDEVLVSTPYFVEYGFYAENHGGVLKPVPCGDNFDLDLAGFEAAITPKTAAVIVNSPNNPSGKIYDQAALRELGDLLTRKSQEIGRTIYLISDEPYRYIIYDGVQIPSVFSVYPHSLVATSYSKDLSIPGERIGWIAVHPEAEDVKNLMNGLILANRILGFVNAPALMQRAVAESLGAGVDPVIYQKKRDVLCDALERAGFTFYKPSGTFYLFPEAPGGDDLAIVDELQKERILAVPGRGFGQPGFFRLSYAVPDSVISGSVDGFLAVGKRLGLS